jgi:hypothetical protein
MLNYEKEMQTGNVGKGWWEVENFSAIIMEY